MRGVQTVACTASNAQCAINLDFIFHQQTHPSIPNRFFSITNILEIILNHWSLLARALTQVAGRIVEVGIHKLRTLGLSPKVISYACGYAPISLLCTDFEVVITRTNDAILYGGIVHCTVGYDDEVALQKIVEKAPSGTSREYGRPFLQILREADRNFYKIYHNLFALATLIVNNAKTGSQFSVGQNNFEALKESFGFGSE
jgi:methenyltetrahydromethanopterin cyclohydrolase